MAEIPGDAAGTQTGLAETLIAGYLAGCYQHLTVDQALRYGAAAATFHVSQVGHQPATRRDIDSVLGDVQIVSYEAPATGESGSGL